jgi:membrane protein
LIWIYVSWLILLIGAQLACYVQFPAYLRHGRELIERS